jgi:hypothetical protein
VWPERLTRRGAVRSGWRRPGRALRVFRPLCCHTTRLGAGPARPSGLSTALLPHDRFRCSLSAGLRLPGYDKSDRCPRGAECGRKTRGPARTCLDGWCSRVRMRFLGHAERTLGIWAVRGASTLSLQDNDLTVSSLSPCLPANSLGCGLIGALGQGCGTVAIQPMSWGQIKGAYR